jgi:hypothetical protein
MIEKTHAERLQLVENIRLNENPRLFHLIAFRGVISRVTSYALCLHALCALTPWGARL